MEDDKIFITIEVNGKAVTSEAKNLRDLKIARKQYTDEFLAGNDKAAISIAKIKDKLEDLGEAANTVKGSKVERLTSSFQLLGQGLASFDTDKIKTGFKGLGAAMSAIPIFLLIEGIKLLIENFDVVINVAKNFLGITNDNEVAVKRLIEAIDRESEALKNFQAISDAATTTELLNAKKRGDSEEELTKITVAGYQRRIKEAQANLEFQTETYNRLLKLDNASAEELKKSGEAQLAANENLKKLISGLENFKIQSQIDTNKRAEDEDKKATEKYKQELEKRKQAKDKADKDFNIQLSQSLADEQALLDADIKATEDRQKQRDAYTLAGVKLLADQQKEVRDQAAKDAQDSADKEIEMATKTAETIALGKKDIEQKSFSAAKGLSDLYFQTQENSAKGNQKKLNEIAKQKFNVDKAFNIAQATIDGIRSVQAALTIPPPFGQILAVANGVLAAANVARISSVQFTGTSSAAPSADFGVSAPPPPPAPRGGSNSPLGERTASNANQGPIQAVVVETQLRDVQDTIGLIQRRSKF